MSYYSDPWDKLCDDIRKESPYSKRKLTAGSYYCRICRRELSTQEFSSGICNRCQKAKEY